MPALHCAEVQTKLFLLHAFSGFADYAGILLRRFLGDPSLEGVSHVVIDEVHERSVDVDLALLLLRDLLARDSRVKVILMSATANAELFAAYFSHGTPKVRTF